MVFEREYNSCNLLVGQEMIRDYPNMHSIRNLLQFCNKFRIQLLII